MIQSVETYTAICDRCGADVCDGGEYSGWDMTGLEAEIDAEDWLTDGNKHYCWNCQEYDEATDEYVVKKEQPK